MSKLVLVVAYDEPDEMRGDEFPEMVARVRHIFADKPGVQAFVAVRESADAVLNVFGRADRAAVAMLEDLETHVEEPGAVLAIASDLRHLLGIPARVVREGGDR